MIQIHERARQARIYYFQVNKLHLEKKKQQQMSPAQLKKIVEPDPQIFSDAAATIERVWRGHHVRKTIKRNEEERRLLIGICILASNTRRQQSSTYTFISYRND